jgi:hypothetical protein
VVEERAGQPAPHLMRPAPALQLLHRTERLAGRALPFRLGRYHPPIHRQFTVAEMWELEVT